MDNPLSVFSQAVETTGAKIIVVNQAKDALTQLQEIWQVKDVYLPQDDMLRSLPWHENGYDEKDYVISEDIQQVAVRARAGIAESGSIAVACSFSSPTGLNFLPHSHCVFLQQDDIFFYFEDLRNSNAGEMFHNAAGPINFITGPSRTADIEQTLQIGAHGPAELIIVVYNTTTNY